MNKNKTLLSIYLNEFNYSFIKKGAKKYNCKNIISFFKKKKINTFTKDKVQNKNLDPWVQNVSINTGLPSNIHKVYNLGESFFHKQEQIWDLLAKNNKKTAIWGPMNSTYKKNKNLKLFFPDPWNFSQKTYPKKLKYLSMLQNYYAQNYLNPKFSKIILYGISFFYGLIVNNYILKILYYSPFIFWVFLKKGIKNYLLFLLLDLISVIALKKEVNNHKLDFALIFLNSIAHFQHNHWDEKKNDKIFFKFIDLICLELKSLEKKFNVSLVFNGFSQKKIKKEYILRPIDPKFFLLSLGVNFIKLEQNMTNGGLIFFKNNKERMENEKILKNYSFGKFYFFEIKKINNTTTFYRVQVKSFKNFKQNNIRSIKINKYLSYDSQNRLRKNLKNYKINKHLLSDLEFLKCSGKHIKEGIILYKDILIKKKFITKNKLENHKIFQIIWDYFQ